MEYLSNPFALRDIANYRAAAIAAATFDPESLSDWQNWPVPFSATGRPYRSLMRTLMNLPGGIPPGLLEHLRGIHLERPITNRLELLALLSLAQHKFYHQGHINPMHERCFMFATAEQIKRAMTRLSPHLGRTLKATRAADVKNFVRFVADYPEAHTGNVVGLTNKAIDWHEHRQEEERQRVLALHNPTTPLKAPPVPLPEEPGIKFLATIGDVVAESETMQHCVAGYTGYALDGLCYLFHAEKDGEHATVEVLPNGQVSQAQGPKNTENRAVTWGKRVLTTWGKQIMTI